MTNVAAQLSDDRIKKVIIVAEERFIRDILGYDFYESLLAEKNKFVTDTNKVELQTVVRAENNSLDVFQGGELINSASLLSEANRKLWRMHLWQLVAECVLMVAYPDNYADLSSQGLVHNTPKFDGLPVGAGAITPELKTLKYLQQNMLKGKIGPLIENMHKFICKQKHLYPLYDKDCNCDASGRSYQGNGPMILDIYQDFENNDCQCQ
ncbi:MAG TPA: hypothetical protein DCQ29_00925 [Chitinophagaceae bacterium]|nr:hypothetical protein [Chitinophagaceae bacterium]